MHNKVAPGNRLAIIEDGCFVSGALAVVLRVSRYLGTASLRFTKKKDGWRVSLCPGLSLFSCLIVTITGFWNMATKFSDKLYSIQETDSGWSTVQHAMRLAETFLISLMAMWMVYNAPAHMKHMMRCLNQVQKIHLDLKINYWPRQQKKHVALVISWLIVWMIVSSCDYFVVSVFNNESPLWIKFGEFMYYVHYAVIHTRVLQFVLIVVHVNFNFRTINNYLRNHLKDAEREKPKKDSLLLGENNRSKSIEGYITRLNNYINSLDGGRIGVTYVKVMDKKSNTLSESFHALCCAYGATCCVMRTVNRAEGMMLMLMMGFLFNSFMSTFYFFITNIVYSESSFDEGFYIFFGIVLTTWACLHLFNLLLIIEPCHLTHLEMQTTRELVSRLMRCTDSAYDQLEIELDQFYKAITVNKVYYNPLNVIMMGRSLVIDILGSVTTYLVILIKIK